MTTKTIRAILCSLVAVTVAGVSAGCPSSEPKKPLKISINIWPGYGYAFIARDKGFFKKHNVDVELILKDTIDDAKRAYVNDETDGLFNVFPDIIMLNSEGVHTDTVDIIDYSDTADVIIGRPELSGLSDLKGKKISFEGVNSFSHIFVLKTLKNAGVEEFEVQFKNVPAMNVLEQLEQGEIDAGHTWEPGITRAKQKGYKVLATAGNCPGIIIDVLAFRSTITEQRPGDIQAVIAALAEARAFLQTRRDEGLTIMAKAMNMPREELESGLKGIKIPDQKACREAMVRSGSPLSLYRTGEDILHFYHARGQLTKMITIDEVLAPRFITGLEREGK